MYHTVELQETNVRRRRRLDRVHGCHKRRVPSPPESVPLLARGGPPWPTNPSAGPDRRPPLPSRSRQLGKNSLRNGGHHAAPSAIQHHHHVLSSRLGGEHVVLLLLLERLHVPGLGSATTAFGRVFLFCLHRVLFLGRSGPSVLLTRASLCACAHSQRRSAQVQTGHGQLSNDGNLARR